MIDYLLRALSCLSRGVDVVYTFFVGIFLSGPLWHQCLAGTLLLGVAFMIIVAWKVLIYTDYLMKPENITWMKGSELGDVVLNSREDVKKTCDAIGKGLSDFITGLGTGLYGLTCVTMFSIALVCYCMTGLVFGVISAILLGFGLMYGTCWAIKDGTPFILSPSHWIKPMMKKPAPPPAPVTAAPPARATAFAPRAVAPRQLSPARAPRQPRQRSPAPRAPVGDIARLAAARAIRRGVPAGRF
jgi:hypothetical protein